MPPENGRASLMRERARRLGASTKTRAAQVGRFLLKLHHSTTPRGKAEAAWERGDRVFQIELDMDSYASEALSRIEQVGWHLHHLSAATRTDSDGDAYPVGVYLFKRVRPESSIS